MASPEVFIDQGGEVQVIQGPFQAMDTSSAENYEVSAQTRGTGQLGLTTTGKRGRQPTEIDGQGEAESASTSLENGVSTGNGADEDFLCSDYDRDPTNSCAGWIVVGSRRRQKATTSTGTSPQRGSPSEGKPGRAASALITKAKEKRRKELKAQYVAKVNASMAKAARMPIFAKRSEHRVVIRPRGGLAMNNVKLSELRAAVAKAAGLTMEEVQDDSIAPNFAQNIAVLSTPSEERSFRYGSIRNIVLGDRTYEAYAYKCTPENTARGVISGVGVDETEENITRSLVNKQNPKILAAHRLGRTESVVILFDGDKVPYYVKYEGVVAKCTLYRQHREVCEVCGKVGHRRDVCPTPHVKVCFACGRNNPDEEHVNFCKPRCKLCGGAHPTGAGSCKNKFKVPPQIRARLAEKNKREDKMATGKMAMKKETTFSRQIERSSRNPEKIREAPPQQQRGRSKSKSRPEGMTWADVIAEGNARKRRDKSAGPAQRPRSVSKSDRRERAEPDSGRGGTPQAAAVPAEGKNNKNMAKSQVADNKEEARETKTELSKIQRELQEMKAVVEALQRTIHQQREHINKQDILIAKLRKGELDNESGDMETQEDSTDGSEEEPPMRPRPKKARKGGSSGGKLEPAANGNETAIQEEIIPEESETEGESSSVKSEENTHSIRIARSPIGYAGLNNRIARLEIIYKKWDRNLDAMEQRIIQRCTQLVQQQIAQQFEQLQKQVTCQFDNMMRQIREVLPNTNDGSS